MLFQSALFHRTVNYKKSDSTTYLVRYLWYVIMSDNIQVSK